MMWAEEGVQKRRFRRRSFSGEVSMVLEEGRALLAGEWKMGWKEDLLLGLAMLLCLLKR